MTSGFGAQDSGVQDLVIVLTAEGVMTYESPGQQHVVKINLFVLLSMCVFVKDI